MKRSTEHIIEWKSYLSKILVVLLAVIICLVSDKAGAAANTLQDGIQAYNQSNFPKAEYCFKNILRYDPDNFTLRYYLAVTLVKNRKLEEAKYHFKYIISANPDSNIAYWAKVGLNTINRTNENSSASRIPNKIVLSISDNSNAIIADNVTVNNVPAGKFVIDTFRSLAH